MGSHSSGTCWCRYKLEEPGAVVELSVRLLHRVETFAPVKMKNHKRLLTNTLLLGCLLAMSLLTLLSLYMTFGCLQTRSCAEGIPSMLCFNSPADNRLSSALLASKLSHQVEVETADILRYTQVFEQNLSNSSEMYQLLIDSPPVTAADEEKVRSQETEQAVDSPAWSVQRLADIYLETYKELERRKVFRKYPVHGACNTEKRPAVPCNDTDCKSRLSDDLQQRISSLLSSTEKARRNFSNPLHSLTAQLPYTHLTIVTGASGNHFLESQAMIEKLHQNLFPQFKNISFYFYDMGLSSDQVTQLQRHCRCRVIKFPFHRLSSTINDIKCYTWKPLIIQAHLPRTDILIWADASVRINSSKNDALYKDIESKGLLVSLSDYYIRPVAHNTAMQMFRYFNIEPCSVANFQELEASFIGLHNDAMTRDVVVAAWAACAVDPGCMCPAGSLSMHHCDGGVRQYAKCHRFDQSALTLILLKLFREHFSTFVFDHTFYKVQRGEKVKYFDRLDHINGTVIKPVH